MKKIVRFLSICFYHRFITIKNCDEAKKRNLKFSHNNNQNTTKTNKTISFWHDEYGIQYTINEHYNTKSI
ncbi:hypothetical protein [Flavobacterium gelidilacus]|uniref:hypothetical protein n=1 Tax=Flavobacterium gelidilacus TaxID=206041 RepID=UPI0012FB12AE|nr:hypothetical protein [Flavobacterium gelidilacus]